MSAMWPLEIERRAANEVGVQEFATTGPGCLVVPTGPGPGTIGPMVSVELQRIEALELLGMTLAHLNDADATGEVSPRVPLLIAIRDKLAVALREES